MTQTVSTDGMAVRMGGGEDEKRKSTGSQGRKKSRKWVDLPSDLAGQGSPLKYRSRRDENYRE